MGNELTWGMITRGNRASLSLSTAEFGAVCEGFGTEFCMNCPFAVYIPNDCTMLEADEGDECSLCCTECKMVCPCNRTFLYDEVRREVVKAEIVRVTVSAVQDDEESE